MSEQRITGADLQAAIAAKPKKPRKLNVVATHYVVTYKGVLEVYDVITAPSRAATAYKRRLRGLTEGGWYNLRSDQLVDTIAKAKVKAIKDKRKSIKYYQKEVKNNQAALKKMQKIKVK